MTMIQRRLYEEIKIMTTPTKAELLAQIAKQKLFIETLETRNSDSSDFHDLSVASIKSALNAAYEEGREKGYEEGYEQGHRDAAAED